MKKILMIAFHYPPFRGSSGIHRTLKFSRYLRDYAWQPIILTASPSAYPNVGSDQLGEIPSSVPVIRAFALDTARHLSLRGAYPKSMALPDRWVSWWLGAVPSGLRLVRQYRPDVIWSTYPIATAHLIALTLHRLTGIPWVADFRDSMTEDNYPSDLLTRRTYRWIERQTIAYSSRLIFTAPMSRQMYLKRYPSLPPERCLLIPNGYDEEDFKQLLASPPMQSHDDRPMRLLHAGLIYPDERDPQPFFRVLARLKSEGRAHASNLCVDLMGAGSEGYLATVIRELGIDDLVHLLPALPYRQALRDCAAADALLLLQAASCNHQIPAKVYEYLRLRKPILALTPGEGDTARLLREMGGATIVDLSDEQAQYLTLPEFLTMIRQGTHALAGSARVRRFDRRNQTFELAKCLAELCNGETTCCMSERSHC